MNDYHTLFREALELGKKRKYSEAISRLRRIVSVTDEVEEAFLYLGRSYHAVGAFPQAIDMLRRFVELRPDSAAGFFFLGRALLSAGELKRAAAALRNSLSIRPDLGYAQSLLGYIFLKLGRSSEALTLLGEAVKKHPDNHRVFHGYLNALLVEGIKSFKRGHYEYAEEVFSFLSEHGSRGILSHLYLGMIHRIQGEYEEALKDYRNALEYSPEDELIIYRIAVLMVKTGRHDEAFELFKRVAPHSQESGKFTAPTASEGDRYLARQYFDRGNYSQALHYALQVLHQNKSDVAMHLVAGECYREMEEYELSGNHFNRVFDSDRKHIGAHYGIALIHWQRGEYEEMLGRLRKVERLDPGNETVHYYTVLCSWKLNTDADKLLPVVQEAVRKFGPDIHLLNALADTYGKCGYEELADKWYRKLIGMNPGEITAYEGLIDLFESGRITGSMDEIFDGYLSLAPEDQRRRRIYILDLYRRGEYGRSIEKIEEYLSMRSEIRTETEVYFQRMRAICYRKTGEYETAAELYRRLLTQTPEREELLRPYIYCLEKSERTQRAAETAESITFSTLLW